MTIDFYVDMMKTGVIFIPIRQTLCERAEQAKNILNSIPAMETETAALEELVRRLRDRAQAIPSNLGEHLESADRRVCRLLDAEDRQAALLAKLAVRRGHVNAALRLMRPEEALLLRLRCLKGQDWDTVGVRLYMSERTARRHFEPALLHFADAYEECK